MAWKRVTATAEIDIKVNFQNWKGHSSKTHGTRPDARSLCHMDLHPKQRKEAIFANAITPYVTADDYSPNKLRYTCSCL
jgi:hypothetical protein